MPIPMRSRRPPPRSRTLQIDLALGALAVLGVAFLMPRPDVTAQWELVARLTASSWYLPVNQMYRGHGVLVFDPRHATRLDELSTA